MIKVGGEDVEVRRITHRIIKLPNKKRSVSG